MWVADVWEGAVPVRPLNPVRPVRPASPRSYVDYIRKILAPYRVLKAGKHCIYGRVGLDGLHHIRVAVNVEDCQA